MVLQRADAEAIASRIINRSQAEETLVILNSAEKALTRFGENQIHQNVSETHFDVEVQAAIGKKVGIAHGNLNRPEDGDEVAARALAIARAQGEKEDYAGLAAPAAAPALSAYDEETANYDADRRADAAGAVIAAARAAKMTAAGAFSVGTHALAVANSRGAFHYHLFTQANLTSVIMAEDASGYCEGGGWRVGSIDCAALAEDAVRRAERGRRPRDIQPGQYDLIVEPYALGELFSWMSFVIFDTRGYLEGRTLLAKRMGERIMGDNVTLVDDGLSLEGLPLPFDFEGTPRQRVVLVDKGVATGLVFDLATAALAGKTSTGHNLGPGAEGPFPLHLALSPGDSSVPEMIQSMERGLYVTRFHYVNGFVEPMQAVFTGMTRDGTYWVEDGVIKHGVKNLRWTESMLRAFSNVRALSRERKLVGADDGMGIIAPAVYFRDFTFTGTTEH